MWNKHVCAAVLATVCCLPLTGEAAVCRAGQAAQAGSQAGYEVAKRAAEAWAERERTVSDQLQECLSRIRMTQITLPQFPSISVILDKIVEKICQAAVDKINSSIPADIDPWKNLNTNISLDPTKVLN